MTTPDPARQAAYEAAAMEAVSEPAPERLTLRLDNSDGRYFPGGPHASPWGQVTFTVVQPRPWWRRLLRLPAKQVTRGPYRIERWEKR